MKKLIGTLALASFLSLSGTVIAQDRIELTEGEMDQVTAGWTYMDSKTYSYVKTAAVEGGSTAEGNNVKLNTEYQAKAYNGYSLSAYESTSAKSRPCYCGNDNWAEISSGGAGSATNAYIKEYTYTPYY